MSHSETHPLADAPPATPKPYRELRHWQRAGLALLFLIAYGILDVVVLAIFLFQAVHLLIRGTHNDSLADLTANLNVWLKHCLDYALQVRQDAPFPLNPQPPKSIPDQSVPNQAPSA